MPLAATTEPRLGVRRLLRRSVDRFGLASAAVLILSAGCSSQPKPAVAKPQPKLCIPRCHRNKTCDELDAKLVAARQPLLRCIGREADHGRLANAHKCYRALRLIESARWWLRTLTSEDGIMHSIYRVSVEPLRLNFLCQIERLTRARRPAEVEKIYLEIVRSFP